MLDRLIAFLRGQAYVLKCHIILWVDPDTPGELGIRCTVEKGPVLSVIVAADQPDGTGQCAIRRREGPELVVPIVILTVK